MKFLRFSILSLDTIGAIRYLDNAETPHTHSPKGHTMVTVAAPMSATFFLLFVLVIAIPALIAIVRTFKRY